MDPRVQAAIDAAKASTKNTPAVAAARKVLTPEEMLAGLEVVPTLVETGVDEVEHVILYGEPGAGKTQQAGLLSEFFNILWFDGDKGLTTLLHNLPKELQQRIRPIRIPDSTLEPRMLPTMLKVITGRQVNICFDHGIVDCPVCIKQEGKTLLIALNQLPKNWVVVMDSQTQLVMSALAIAYYKVNPNMVGKDTDDFWRGEKGEMFAYWGGVKNCMDKFGSYVKDLKCQFVTISHETMAEMEDGVTKRMVPVSGSENSSKSYAKYYGTEIHCKKQTGKITFSSQATGSATIQTKSRSNVALEKEETPALLHVFRPEEAKELLKGSYTEWYFKEGWKPEKERKLSQPKPKGVLPS